jgi:hypothetical protein
MERGIALLLCLLLMGLFSAAYAEDVVRDSETATKSELKSAKVLPSKLITEDEADSAIRKGLRDGSIVYSHEQDLDEDTGE